MTRQQTASVTEPMKRPASITVISWMLILLGCAVGIIVGTIVVVTVLTVGLDPPVVGFVVAVAIAVLLPFIMGIGMLRGHNWARQLYLWAS